MRQAPTNYGMITLWDLCTFFRIDDTDPEADIDTLECTRWYHRTEPEFLPLLSGWLTFITPPITPPPSSKSQSKRAKDEKSSSDEDDDQEGDDNDEDGSNNDSGDNDNGSNDGDRDEGDEDHDNVNDDTNDDTHHPKTKPKAHKKKLDAPAIRDGFETLGCRLTSRIIDDYSTYIIGGVEWSQVLIRLDRNNRVSDNDETGIGVFHGHVNNSKIGGLFGKHVAVKETCSAKYSTSIPDLINEVKSYIALNSLQGIHIQKNKKKTNRNHLCLLLNNMYVFEYRSAYSKIVAKCVVWWSGSTRNRMVRRTFIITMDATITKERQILQRQSQKGS
jgi:hypothetical protein